MFDLITTAWPPIPGTFKTGHKRREVNGSHTEPLQDLHNTAWWTGLKIAGLPIAMKATVTLNNFPAFPGFPGFSWSQGPGVYHPLPFPLPASMAKEMELSLTIETEYKGLMVLFFTFHELGVPKDQYLFAEEGSKPVLCWSQKRSWSTPASQSEPVWKTLHVIVSPTQALIDGAKSRLFCIHDWNETI